MSNEIALNFNIQVTNGTYRDSFSKQGAYYDQNSQGASGGIQSIGTSEEDLVISDSVTTNGYLVLHNLDTTNYVDWGEKSGGVMKPIGRLKPGDIAVFRMKPSETLRLVDNTASVKVEFFLLND
jgi:hypothetical protein